MDYKVTKFNSAAFYLILRIRKSGYPLIHDPSNQDNAAYMKRIKKYVDVMSNLIGVYQ